MVDHALGVAGGTRGVVERNGVPFIGGRLPRKFRIAFGDEALVLRLADALARARVLGIVHVDHERFLLEGGESARDGTRELAVGDQDLGPAVPEHEGDRLGVEARVQRVDDRARHGNAEMTLEHFRGIREHRRDRVADAYAAVRKRRGETPATRIGLGPRGASRPVDDCEASGIDGGGALDESQRRQGRVVGRVPVEIELVRIRLVRARHRRSTPPCCVARFHTRSSISTAVSKRRHTHCVLFSASMSASRLACSASSSALGRRTMSGGRSPSVAAALPRAGRG